MSANTFKRLNVADTFVIPYTANKSWDIPSSSFAENKITINIGTNYSESVFDPQAEYSTNGQYDRLVYNSINSLYYPNFLPTSSLLLYNERIVSPITNDTITSASYYNGHVNLGNLDTIKFFPTGTRSVIYVLNVPRNITSEKILPTTFEVYFSSGSTYEAKIYDDGNYNLFYSGSNISSSIGTVLSQSSYVGNVFYEQNIAVLTIVPNSMRLTGWRGIDPYCDFASVSVTPSITRTVSRTPSVSETPSATPSITVSISESPSISITPSVTPTVTPSFSGIPSFTPTISNTPSVTTTISETPSISVSPSISETPSITPSLTPSVTVTISETPSVSVTPSATVSTSFGASATATPSITVTVSETPSVTPSVTPTVTSTISVTPSITVSISETPIVTPSPTQTVSLTISTTPSATLPSVSRTPSATLPSVSRTPSATRPSVSRTPSVTRPSVSLTPSITIPSISLTPSVSISLSATPSVSISRPPSISRTPSVSTSKPVACNCYRGQVNTDTPPGSPGARLYYGCNGASALIPLGELGYEVCVDISKPYSQYITIFFDQGPVPGCSCPGTDPTPSPTISTTPSRTPSVSVSLVPEPSLSPSRTPSITTSPTLYTISWYAKLENNLTVGCVNDSAKLQYSTNGGSTWNEAQVGPTYINTNVCANNVGNIKVEKGGTIYFRFVSNYSSYLRYLAKSNTTNCDSAVGPAIGYYCYTGISSDTFSIANITSNTTVAFKVRTIQLAHGDMCLFDCPT